MKLPHSAIAPVTAFHAANPAVSDFSGTVFSNAQPAQAPPEAKSETAAAAASFFKVMSFLLPVHG